MILPDWLWPIRTGKTFFDVWSLIHLAFWLSVGTFFGLGHVRPVVGWPIIIVLAYVWEVAERLFFWRFVKHKEVWFNSFISDPLMTCSALLGYSLAGQSCDATVMVGLLAAWIVIGANIGAVQPRWWLALPTILVGVLLFALARDTFWLAPWYDVWVLEPLAVVGVPTGLWLISKQ